MAENLVIVESPAKAKTIEGFLGKDFLVKSSFGHVRDLIKNDKGIRIEENFTPVYEVSDDKTKVVDELRRLAKKAGTVWLATDEDREGEAISWHLSEALNLNPRTVKRIVFHEITKKAIQEAVKNPRTIDMDLVNAQQARRILDRLVGFELSPVLWKKVKANLSAGRVQSVSVRLIVEREREVENFNSESSFKVSALFMVPDAKGRRVTLKAEHPKRFDKEDKALAFLKKVNGADFSISALEVKPGKKSPSAPFTTSTLQQEASRKLSFSVAQTMRIAQKLYESGKITYMRTDSVNLSDFAMDEAKKTISSQFGKNYSHPRQFRTKSANAQEAHEAIRPTDMNVSSIEGESAERRLYELIWKRTIASQMADAQLEKTVVTIVHSKGPEELVSTGEVVRFDGFLRVYMESSDDENEEKEDGLLPPLAKGQKLDFREMTATERFSSPPARYTEASLVKKLEELGIGRPSTYAPTISTIQKRGYVVKEDRPGKERDFRVLTLNEGSIKEETRKESYQNEKAKLFPTDIGTVVTDFLSQHFPEIMDYGFTASVEEEFDEIAKGKMAWEKMIKKFYGPFHKLVEKTEKNSVRATGERILGKDPQTGFQVVARIGRFGPLVQISSGKEEDKPRFASLRSDQRLESISLEEALDLFKMPRTLGQFEGEDLVVAIGRFGPYVRHKGLFVSLPKTDDPYTVEQDRAIELVLAKRKAEAERIMKTFKENPEVRIIKGRWGPYLEVDGRNYRIPKEKDPLELSLADCLSIAETTEPSGKIKKFARKKAEEKPVKKAASRTATARKAATQSRSAAKTKPVKTATKMVSKSAVKSKSPAKKGVKKAAVKKPAAKKGAVKKNGRGR